MMCILHLQGLSIQTKYISSAQESPVAAILARSISLHFSAPQFPPPPISISLNIFMNQIDVKMNISGNLTLITMGKAN